MIVTIDNKIHHLKELDFIERQLHGLFNPNQFYDDLSKFLFDSPDIDLYNKTYFSFNDTVKTDEFIKNYFYAKIPEAETWFIRAYVIGRLLVESDLEAKQFIVDQVSKLPSYLQDVVKRYNLTIEEAKTIEKAVEKGASLVTNTVSNTQQQIKLAIQEATIRNEGINGIANRLKSLILSEEGELNRDWTRVAITEANDAFTNGYISLLNDGDYVLGISMPDACPHCANLIHNQVYRVLKTPPPDYSNLEGEEYDRIADIWENYIWEGKSNFGRSTSPRKRIDKTKGNKEENLINRKHHEISMPVIPLHPHCRCRWTVFNPRLQWIDEHGNIRLKVENPSEHKQWYENNILGFEDQV